MVRLFQNSFEFEQTYLNKHFYEGNTLFWAPGIRSQIQNAEKSVFNNSSIHVIQ